VTGTVDVSGGQMSTSAGNLVIGSAGIGIVNVNSGGNVFVTDPQLVLASAPGSSGTLNLNSGGRLTVTARPNGIMAGSGTAVFNLAGGKIQLFDKGYAGLTSSVPMTLSNTSTIDTAGVSATLSGTLSGSGSLTKISGGTLTLSNQHTYTGDTIVDGGSLALTGAASAITANHSLFIGNDAAGILDLSAGASVTTTSIARLGGNAAGNGTGNIDGAALHVGDYLEVGSLGIGALNVTNGGSVTANTTIAFGVSGASSGTGTVTGAGSNLSAGTTLYVGYGSSGTLTVGSGGSISAGNIVLGATSGGGSGALVLNPGGR
jgi:autotransporter-associated beta strand protein/T5SS/PEP-CTERM-associated repeat protein